MLRLTFTDSKKQTKIIGESEDAMELYNALYAHARRMFIHPVISAAPAGIADYKAQYIVGQTKDGCTYSLENIGDGAKAQAAGCSICNVL